MKDSILFVDDDANLLAGLRRALWKEPYEFLSAASGEIALALLVQRDVDVIVSDNQMPGMEGVEFLRLARLRRPNTIRFMLTGNATLDVAISAINQGEIHRFFTKPCNNVDLAITIRQALQQKKLLKATKLLVEQNKGQRAVLEQVELESPGITNVERDANGAIILSESPQDLEALLSEIATW